MEQTKSRRSAAIVAAVIFAVLAVRYFLVSLGVSLITDGLLPKVYQALCLQRQ